MSRPPSKVFIVWPDSLDLTQPIWAAWSVDSSSGGECYELAAEVTFRAMRKASAMGRIRSAMKAINPNARSVLELLEHAMREIESIK